MLEDCDKYANNTLSLWVDKIYKQIALLIQGRKVKIIWRLEEQLYLNKLFIYVFKFNFLNYILSFWINLILISPDILLYFKEHTDLFKGRIESGESWKTDHSSARLVLCLTIF